MRFKNNLIIKKTSNFSSLHQLIEKFDYFTKNVNWTEAQGKQQNKIRYLLTKVRITFFAHGWVHKYNELSSIIIQKKTKHVR
jgi:hypothetical protein